MFMKSKSVIACDLDGTLTESKGVLTSLMSHIICSLLPYYRFAVISGGSFPQFEKQFIHHLSCAGKSLHNMYLFPTNGSACYTYNALQGFWHNVYNERLTKDEIVQVYDAIKAVMAESGIDFDSPYGEIIENRGGQVTFSGRGQHAPLSVKSEWDPHQEKRKILVALLEKKIPQFEIRIGGLTSIDITRQGIDKIYAVNKIKSMLHVDNDDIVFIGDALYPGGNDEAVKSTGVECLSTSGPTETITILQKFLHS